MRASETEKAYAKRFESLWLRCAESSNVGRAPLDPLLFVGWLIALFAGLRPKTRRVYRAASLVMLDREALQPHGETGWFEAAAILREAKLPPPEGLVAATSSNKLKLLSDDEFVALRNALTTSPLTYSLAAEAYLCAGIITGLRPSEWCCVRLVHRRNCVVLVVRNGKFRKGERAHGRYRRLIWNGDARLEVAYISRYIAIVAARCKDIPISQRREVVDTFNLALGDAIRAISITKWPNKNRHVSLYTTRHTAAAIFKREMHDLASVAALMGHLSDETATSEYARPPRRGSRRAPKFVTPQPHPRDVARVRLIAERRRQFLLEKKERRHAASPHS